MQAITEIHQALPEPLSADADNAPLAAIFSELDDRDWPVLSLERHLSALLIHATSLAPQDRGAWLCGLHQIWRRHGWALTLEGKRALLELAAVWCAWPLAHAIGASLREAAALDRADTWRMLEACRQLGDGDTAASLLIGLQLAYPSEQIHADAYRELQAWLDWRANMPVVNGEEFGDEDLRLEPLAHHHANDFAWQFHDPAIAELCCLPHFSDDDQWHRWLDVIHGLNDQRIFAVLHREWGFIGSVSLILHEGIGFFYYWLGPDFQGHGLGPRAVALMLEIAQRDYGMRCCYAKVFDYNTPSRRALEKIGFEELGICGIAPNENELFYRVGEQRSRNLVVNELQLLLSHIGSDSCAAIATIEG